MMNLPVRWGERRILRNGGDNFEMGGVDTLYGQCVIMPSEKTKI